MNPVLYINNFRGFQNTFIEFCDVNFLVGENSTGKTSIMSLLSILGEPTFWVTQEFNGGDVQLGDFKDIVSNQMENQQYFNIGMIEISEKPSRDDEGTDAWFMTFVNEDGLPVISDYVEIQGNEKIAFSFTRDTIRYKLSKMSILENRKQQLIRTFSKLAKSSSRDHSEYHILKNPKKYKRRIALLIKDELINIVRGNKDSVTENVGIPLPEMLDDLVWFAPVRSQPKRTYDSYRKSFSAEGEHTPYLLRELLSKRARAVKFTKLLEDYGKNSGMFDSFKIKNYGSEAAAPFELDVILSGTPLRISNVGYGVSQILPIIVELIARRKGHWFAIQQPEIHLHPKAQAAIGDILFNLANKSNQKFIIETHSDFIIDRFRLNYKKNTAASKISSQVLFFERTANGNKVYPISIRENGEYEENQPRGFRQFFIREELSLLGIR